MIELIASSWQLHLPEVPQWEVLLATPTGGQHRLDARLRLAPPQRFKCRIQGFDLRAAGANLRLHVSNIHPLTMEAIGHNVFDPAEVSVAVGELLDSLAQWAGSPVLLERERCVLAAAAPVRRPACC